MFSNFSMNTLIYAIKGMILFIISGSLHEFGHAFSAYIKGDNTAQLSGRLTLNPLAHIDIFGSIFFPLIGALTGLPVFGWMKPVPVNSAKLQNPSKDHAIIAFSGPLSNLIQFSIGFLLLKVFGIIFLIANFPGSIFYFIAEILLLYCLINVILMVFNLLPVPPLDGGWILRHFIPDSAKAKFDIFYSFGFIFLLILLMLGALNFIFAPILSFFSYISTNLLNLNIGFFFIPLLISVGFIFLLFKNEIFKFIKKEKFIKNIKTVQEIKSQSTQSLKVKDDVKLIFEKLKTSQTLSDEEEKIIATIKKQAEKITDGICNEEDFHLDDEYCIECNCYPKCISRKIDILRKNEDD